MTHAPKPQQDADDGEVAADLGTIDGPPPNTNAATLKARQEAFMSMIQPSLDQIEAGNTRDAFEALDEIWQDVLARHESRDAGAA